jgi:MerR family mercuric resistance operon transcriptional regulator
MLCITGVLSIRVRVSCHKLRGRRKADYDRAMRIGEAARRSAVSVQALRFYEREGLLRRPARTPAGYRAYTAADVEQVRFIKHCQQLGFALREIRLIAALHAQSAAPDAGPAARAEFLRIARARLAFLDGKIAEFRRLRRQIAALALEAERGPERGCPAGARSAAAARANIGA